MSDLVKKKHVGRLEKFFEKLKTKETNRVNLHG